MQARFGSQFKIEEGKIVAYYPRRQQGLFEVSRARAGDNGRLRRSY
jgi:hypothetical protein